MNPDSQNPTDEPEENGLPQAPTTGTGDDQTPAPAPQAPAGDDGGSDMPEAPEAPEVPEAPAGDAPEAPAPVEGDKEDGAKW
jgi:hypothetical protein